MEEKKAYKNTDVEVYRRPSTDGMDLDGYYQPSLHITKSGALTICVAGTCHTRTIEEWHNLAGGPFKGRIDETPDDPQRAMTLKVLGGGE